MEDELETWDQQGFWVWGSWGSGMYKDAHRKTLNAKPLNPVRAGYVFQAKIDRKGGGVGGVQGGLIPGSVA